MLKVICFDLGGVLVRICRSWTEATEQAGLPARDLDELSEAEAVQRRGAIIDAYQIGRLTCDAYYAALSEAMEARYSPAEVERVHHAWTLDEYPGIAEFVAALDAQSHLVTACLSNTNHAHWPRLNKYPSVARLRIRLASHLLGIAKPDPRIYERTQEHFGCRPDEICFFDDLEDNVRAARAAGWDAERVDHAGDPATQMRGYLSRRGIEV